MKYKASNIAENPIYDGYRSGLASMVCKSFSAHYKEKIIATERFFRTLKNKIYKYITSISKNIYINKLDDIVNKYNNTYHSAIKMKPVDKKSDTYLDSGKETNEKNPKLKIGDTVKISN